MRTSSITKNAFTVAAIISGVAGAWACSSDDSNPSNSGTDTDASTTDAGNTSNTDAQSSQDSGSKTDSGSALPYSGIIGIISSPNYIGDGGPIGSFSASFSPSGPAPGCTQTTSGSCTITDCTHGTSSDGGPPTAGVITISGGTLASPVTLTPDGNGLYSSSQTNGVPFTPGQTFTINAAGATVTAFSGTSGAAAANVAITAPASSADAGIFGGLYTIDRSNDLDLTWTGGVAGAKLAISLGQTNIDVECLVDAASGSTTISKDALGHFAAGSENGSIIVLTSGTATLTSSNASVDVSVSGVSTHGIVTFE